MSSLVCLSSPSYEGGSTAFCHQREIEEYDDHHIMILRCVSLLEKNEESDIGDEKCQDCFILTLLSYVDEVFL